MNKKRSWSITSDLKLGVLQSIVGSNSTLSDTDESVVRFPIGIQLKKTKYVRKNFRTICR